MKTIGILVMFSFSLTKVNCQNDDLKIYFDTDFKFGSSANDTRKEAKSGIGTLGIRFEKRHLFGAVNFTVFSKNDNIQTTDTNEVKLFGTNLLLPQNSSNNISNFTMCFGTRSYRFREDLSNVGLWSYKKFGAYVYFSVHNTTWKKDTISMPVSIVSGMLNFTYLILDEKFMGSEEKIRLILSTGFNLRRMGGDYGIESNSNLRKTFLGTERLGFSGFNMIGARLEVSKFYGQMNLTYFNRNQNIVGFSGNQAVISIGVIADLEITSR
jgi:hypothetical protein